ncbi:MAG: TRAP transporter small permease subunit [Proteobacteria bacterium]|nr:TRAP transporter small permease subunit [Pseudomonadota bacterium]
MLKKICQSIDSLNEWTAKIGCWLIIFLTFLVTVEVILRYGFNRPSIWIWDVNVQLLGTISILGGGYALLHGSHIGVDVMVERLSSRKRAILELVTSSLFFLAVGVLLKETTAAAWVSVQTREKYFSFWMPPIYPFKVVMAAGILFLLLQGIAKFIRNLMIVTSHEASGVKHE